MNHWTLPLPRLRQANCFLTPSGLFSPFFLPFLPTSTYLNPFWKPSRHQANILAPFLLDDITLRLWIIEQAFWFSNSSEHSICKTKQNFFLLTIIDCHVVLCLPSISLFFFFCISSPFPQKWVEQRKRIEGERKLHLATHVSENEEQNRVVPNSFVKIQFNHNWIYDEQIILMVFVTTKVMFCFILI